MDSPGNSHGRQLQPSPFPELEKVLFPQPTELFRPARRMFGVHKNMHSPGFYMGSTQLQRRYMEKALGELRKKHGEEKLEETERLRGELRKREEELEKVRKEYGQGRGPKLRSTLKGEQSLLGRTGQRSLAAQENNHSSLLAPRASLSPTHQRVKSESPVPSHAFSPSPLPPALPHITPHLRNDTSYVHKLAALPLFQAERYTRHRPKMQVSNPITGTV